MNTLQIDIFKNANNIQNDKKICQTNLTPIINFRSYLKKNFDFLLTKTYNGEMLFQFRKIFEKKIAISVKEIFKSQNDRRINHFQAFSLKYIEYFKDEQLINQENL